MLGLYMEELKGGRISSPEMLCVMLGFSSSRPSLIEQWKSAGIVPLSTLVPSLLSAMGDDDHAAAKTLVLVIDKKVIGSLTSQLLKGIADNKEASTRRSCA